MSAERSISGNTRRQLISAIKQLMSTQSFRSIRVNDICDLCHINRKSFYYHYKDKFDLVNNVFYTEFILPFTNKLVKGETIKIFNYGNCKRDFTYVDDIVEGVVRVMKKAPDKKNGEDGLPIPPYAVYNIGNQNPENLLDFVQILSEELVRAKVLPEDYDFEAHKELVPMQPGDVPVTYADTSALERDFGYKPSTSLRTGLRNFAEWYAEFYK